MQRAVQISFRFGKLNRFVGETAAIKVFRSRRLFVTDIKSKHEFLIDTGADFSVWPANPYQRRHSKCNNKILLFAANGSVIKTYDEKVMSLDLGLRRPFNWPFIIAAVQKPIIGADFLHHFALMVDLKNARLVDENTKLFTVGKVMNTPSTGISAFNENTKYQLLIKKYPRLIRTVMSQAEIKHSVTHHIITQGPPLFSRPRRLPPDRLDIAKKEFAFMMEQGICRPSKSPWASPLQMVKKKRWKLETVRGLSTTKCRHAPR